MAFEYSTQGATLDFPNPYRIEIQFLIARGLTLLACAIGLLVLARATGAAVTVSRADAAQGGFLVLVVAAFVLTLAGRALWLRLGAELATGLPSSWSPAAIGRIFIFIVVGAYGLRVAHRLWGRLDFESMTLRAWVVKARSVIFSYRGQCGAATAAGIDLAL